MQVAASVSRVVILVGAVAIVGVLLLVAIGRAVDVATADHVLFTRNGATLECIRTVDSGGRVSYSACRQVP